MDNINEKNSSAFSELKLDHVVFDRLSFLRKGFEQNTPEEDMELKFGAAIRRTDPGKYKVSLRVGVEKKNEYSAEVQLTAFCSISEDCDMKDVVLQRNVVAILFPYVRSELTLLTSQPETKPLVLPALNINNMIDQITIIDEEK